MSLDDQGFLSEEITRFQTHIRSRYAKYFDLIGRVNGPTGGKLRYDLTDALFFSSFWNVTVVWNVSLVECENAAPGEFQIEMGQPTVERSLSCYVDGIRSLPTDQVRERGHD